MSGSPLKQLPVRQESSVSSFSENNIANTQAEDLSNPALKCNIDEEKKETFSNLNLNESSNIEKLEEKADKEAKTKVKKIIFV